MATQIEEETRTQIGQIGKTEKRIGYQIRKPISIFRENRKSNAEKRNMRKLQWTPKPKNRSFLVKKPKNRSKNSQNRKIENLNAPSLKRVTSKQHYLGRTRKIYLFVDVYLEVQESNRFQSGSLNSK